MKVTEKLAQIQQSLKAPKNQYNKFGDFHYRSLEDILEALKPLLKEVKCILVINDEIVLIGGRFYVKATATLHDLESGEAIECSAYAREAESKPKMDESQVTGSSSSYARKYALNGLFLIDDVKDADTRDNSKPDDKKPEQKKPKAKEVITESQVTDLINKCSIDKVDVKKVCRLYKVKGLTDLSPTQYQNILKFWDKVKEAE